MAELDIQHQNSDAQQVAEVHQETEVHHGPHISIKAETLTNVYGLPITNSLINTFVLVVLFFFIGLYFFINQNSKNNKVVFFIRFVVQKLYEMFTPILGDRTKEVFAFLGSFFLFILLSNWLGLLPGVGSITYAVNAEEKVPILRAATADLNTTLALAAVAVILIQYFGFKHLGLGYLGKFFTIKSPIDFFIGILDIVSEFSRLISFAFRLFGNIFAGEVLIAVIAFLIPVLATFPFLLLEVFVGLIQAMVFALLVAVFLNTAAAKH